MREHSLKNSSWGQTIKPQQEQVLAARFWSAAKSAAARKSRTGCALI